MRLSKLCWLHARYWLAKLNIFNFPSGWKTSLLVQLATSQNLVTRGEFSFFLAANQLAASKLASYDPGLKPEHTGLVYKLLVTAASISHFQLVVSKPKKLVTRSQ